VTSPGPTSLRTYFHTSFEEGDLRPQASGGLALQVSVGDGPIGPTVTDRTGFTGVAALQYQGVASGISEVLLFSLDDQVEAGAQLSYLIYPELDADLGYWATYAAVDLVFADGSRLSELGATDQYGSHCSAAGQGEAKILYADQWNKVEIDMAAVVGRKITEIVLTVGPPADAAGGAFQGWVDDLTIARAPAIDRSDLVGLVDTRRGTNASGGFSRGNNLPITAVPNGFTFVTPMTDASTNRWEYAYAHANNGTNRPTLQGIGFSHQASPWMGDRDQLVLMPVHGASPLGDPEARSASFAHDQEIARPDYYRVDLDNGMTAEVAPSDHGAIFRFSFPDAALGRHLVVDSVDDNADFAFDGTALSGWVENGPATGRTRMYIHAEFDAPPQSFDETVGGRHPARALSFAADEVIARVATSFISLEQARHNLDLELRADFDQVRTAAYDAWHERLRVVTVDEDATLPQLRTLYGNLYRLNLYPNAHHENVASKERPELRYASPVSTGPDGETVIRSGAMYVNHGFWDTYRTAWPAYALLYPSLCASLVDGFVEQYREGGWVARWSSPGYADCMTGTSSDVAFADAFLKGVPLPDPLGTYDAALKNATVASPNTNVGRKGIDRGIFLGYTSTDTDESVSWALEGFINDFGIARMASALAEDPATPDARRQTLREEAGYFSARAQNYGILFDPAVDFFQGRQDTGAFAKTPDDFDPCEWGGDFTETDGWNFAFHVPHDGAGLARLYGGRDALTAKLDAFFATPERADKKGTYGTYIHEMLEARAVRMGQFGVSNQPAHHIPFIYGYSGAPARTAEIVRESLRRLFVGETIGQGYPGDEDNGEMSAWWLFAAFGFYPLALGSNAYAIGSPLFGHLTVDLGEGRTLTVEARNNSADSIYVQTVTVNERPHAGVALAHEDVAAGGSIVFEMGPEPSLWGTGPEHALPSLTELGTGSRPLQDLTAACDLPDLADDDSRTATLLADGQVISLGILEGSTIGWYSLTSAAEGPAPARWTLEGTRDGSNWVTIDQREGEKFRWARQTRPFQLATPADYSDYRLTVGAGALAEVELLGQVDSALSS
jgi:predicted alpha-1,2-mannosidase